MFNRVMLLALISMLCLAGCGGGEEEKPAQPAAAAPATGPALVMFSWKAFAAFSRKRPLP